MTSLLIGYFKAVRTHIHSRCKSVKVINCMFEFKMYTWVIQRLLTQIFNKNIISFKFLINNSNTKTPVKSVEETKYQDNKTCKKSFVSCKATPIYLLVLQAFFGKKICQTQKKEKKRSRI